MISFMVMEEEESSELVEELSRGWAERRSGGKKEGVSFVGLRQGRAIAEYCSKVSLVVLILIFTFTLLSCKVLILRRAGEKTRRS